jgi:hypothetical protein
LFLAAGSVAFAGVMSIPTRYGALTLKTLDNVVDYQGQLLFKGRPLHPDVVGNNALSLKGTFHLAGADALLFQDLGGEACPYQWYIVTVSRSGAASTPEFGSCGEFLGAALRGQTIVVRTRGFQGPMEPQAAQVRAAKQTHTYIYSHGKVTENGKPVPCNGPMC